MKTTLANIPIMRLTAPKIMNPVERLEFIPKIFEIVSIFAKIPPAHNIAPSTPNENIGLWYMRVLVMIESERVV